MELKIIREADRLPGAEVREQTTDTITWWVSAAGVTEEGARAFEECANYLYERHWDHAAGHLRDRQSIAYALVEGMDCAVHMRYAGGHLQVELSPDHFCRASFNSGTVTLRERYGIRQFASAR